MARLNPNRDNETESGIAQLNNGYQADTSGSSIVQDGVRYQPYDGPNSQYGSPEIHAQAKNINGQWYLPDNAMEAYRATVPFHESMLDSMGAGILALPAAGFFAAGGAAALGAGAAGAGAEGAAGGFGAWPAAAESSVGLWGPGGAGALEAGGIGATGLGTAGGMGEMDVFMTGLQDSMLNPTSATGAFMPPEVAGFTGGTIGGAAGGFAGNLAEYGGADAAGAAGGVAGTAGGVGGVGGAGGAAGAAGSGASLLSRLLDGTLSAADLSGLLGGVGGTALGLAGAREQIASQERMQQKQIDMNKEMQNQFLGLGAPYRDKLLASYQPGFDIMTADPALGGLMDQSYQSMLRKLSTGGNPYDNPGGLMEAQKYVTQNVALPQLNTHRNQLGSFGQLGVGAGAQAGLNAASSVKPIDSSGTYDALGYGLSRLTQPDQDPMAMMRQMQSMYPLKGWGM
jgi:hypothetical protein